ncbi:MAG: hypothetical protein E7643_07655 [Ruminococcaceae bacterium]|nr:hypothetical protein [Oscillospiraceae bacterium]
MSRWIKILVAALFSFSVLFIGIGYAAVSGDLTISGDMEASLTEIYIRSSRPLASYTGSAAVESTVGTTFNATANLSSSANTAIYEITVANRTPHVYGYLATAADPTVAQNSDIDYALYTNAACTVKLERRAELPAYADGTQGTLTFYLKVSAKSPTASASPYRFVLRFDFKTPISDIPAPGADDSQVAVDNAMTKFAAILNHSTTRSTLIDQMETAGSDNGRASDSYIAYVPGTINQTGYTDDDVCLELFGGELNLIIEGEEYQVYFLLKRENVDNNNATGNADGEEYTLYMTTNQLTTSSGLFSKVQADVYAAVFTSSDDGNMWYQLGDMLLGQAPICDYGGVGAMMSTGKGSFNTDSWKTKQAYYGVASGKEVADVMSATANDLTALNAAISNAEGIMANEYYETIYTETSRKSMEDVLTVARNIVANQRSYTQAQVVSVVAQLESAIEGLTDAA